MTEKAFRVAVAGCGRISANHFAAIAGTPGLELAAVCDADPARAAGAGATHGVKSYTSFDAMLAADGFDVVTIATPSGLHPEQGIQAARAGKHVVTEKPMAISLEGADELLAACEGAGVHLFVVKQNRLNPAVQLVRRALDRGRFGKVYMANTTVRWSRPQEYYEQAKWRGTWALDGGAVMNQASHYVDLMRWMMGAPASVVATTATLARRIEAEDTGAAVVTFRSGAIGVIEVTMLTYPRNLEGSFTLLGERGTVKIGGTAVNRIDHWEFADADEDDGLVASVNTSPPGVYGFGHHGYYRNVLAVLRGGAEADIDGREGRKSLELIVGIYRSAREGKRISFPL